MLLAQIYPQLQKQIPQKNHMNPEITLRLFQL